MNSNPLQKYFRQPKIFISLPSKGLFYPDGVLTGDYSNVPIFAMTGMDELIMKTPDALFSGEATIKLIESCCPYIKDAKEIPSFDVDVLLISIRIATFGPNMTVSHTCKNCKTENEFDIDLNLVLEYYKDRNFNSKLDLGELSVNFKPLSYKDMTRFNTETFKFQKMLSQIEGIADDKKQEFIDKVYEQLAELQLDIFLNSIESVNGPGFAVTETDQIKEWLSNSERTQYSSIKNRLESNREAWATPKQHVKCDNCGTEDDISVTMDQSNFFE